MPGGLLLPRSHFPLPQAAKDSRGSAELHPKDNAGGAEMVQRLHDAE